jgi:hypothetical protein
MASRNAYHPGEAQRTKLLRLIQLDFVQVSGCDNQRPAVRGIATSHLATVQMFNHSEQPIVAGQPHAIIDLQRRIALPFVQSAQQIDDHPRHTLLHNFVPPGAEALAQAPQSQVDKECHRMTSSV